MDIALHGHIQNNSLAIPAPTLKTTYFLGFFFFFFDIQNNLFSMPMFSRKVVCFNLIFLYIENCSRGAIQTIKNCIHDTTKFSKFNGEIKLMGCSVKSDWFNGTDFLTFQECIPCPFTTQKNSISKTARAFIHLRLNAHFLLAFMSTVVYYFKSERKDMILWNT